MFIGDIKGLKIKNKVIIMRNYITKICTILFVLFAALFSTSLIAKTTTRNTKQSKISTKVEEVQEKIKGIFVRDYNYDLLNILASIEDDLQENNMSSVRDKSSELNETLVYYRMESQKNAEENSYAGNQYEGDKVLELAYGNWFRSKVLILPLTSKSSDDKILRTNSVRAKVNLAPYFRQNEIDSAKIRYVAFNIDSEKLRLDLSSLIAAIEENDADNIREVIKDIYSDLLVDYGGNIKLVQKIRDNLVVANLLMESGQYKAAESLVGFADGLMLKLIELTEDSAAEQEKIKQLRVQLKNISRVADENYISEWEKIPDDLGKL